MTTSHMPDPADLLVHAPFVRGLARAALRGDTHVEDAVQETWLAALGNRAPQDVLAARPWLARVVRNVSYTFLRRDTRRVRREGRVARQDSVPSAAEIVAREETRRHLVRALLAIGEPYRSTLILRYYEDLPPREVAKRQGVPVETARTHIKRGLAKLRDELDGDYGDRRTWGLALLPLVDLPGAAAGATVVGLGAKLALLIAVPAAIVAGVLLWQNREDDASRGAGGGGRPALAQPVLIGRAPPLAPVDDEREEGRCVLRGRVTRAGAPVAIALELRRMQASKNLRVWRSPLPRTPALRRLSSATDGSFEIGGLAARGTYEVRAVDTDGTWTFAHVVLFANGQIQTLELRLPTGARAIEGRAVFANGHPFQGAILCWAGAAFGTYTDAEGRFRLSGVPAGPLALSAHKPGAFTFSQGWAQEPGDDAFRPFVVDAGVTLRRGRVVSAIDGRGIGGVIVTGLKTVSSPRGTISVNAQQVSAGDGSYALPSVADMSIRALAEGYAAWHEPQADDEGVIRLRPGARIEGTVRQADGAPLAEAVTVTAVALGSAKPGDFHRVVTAQSGDDGSFRIDAVPGRILLYADGASWASPELGTIHRGRAIDGIFVAQAGETIRRDLSVVRTAVLKGRVEDDEGNPLAGALVSLHHVNGPPKHEALRVMGRYAATDAEGRFTCPGVVAGLRAKARVSHPGFAQAETDAFSLDPGMAAEVTLRLQRTRSARIRVLDAETQEPIAGAQVVVCPKKARGWGYAMQGPRGRTDAEGVVRLDGVPRGGLGARAYAQGYVGDDNPKPLEGAADTGDVEGEITLQPAMTIAGVARVPDGVPFERVRLKLEPVPGSRTSWSPDHATPRKEDGRFEFHGQRPGEYELTAEVHWEQRRYVGEMVVKTADGDIEFELKEGMRPGDWLLRVDDARGAPVHGAHMIRFVESKGYTSADGAWVSEGLGVFGKTWKAERLWVLVEGRIDQTGKRPTLGSVLLGPLEYREEGFDVVLPEERVVTGVVKRAGGSPAAGLQIRAYVDKAAFLGAAEYERLCRRVVQTDAEGRFTICGLGALAYRLEFEKRADGSQPAAAVIDETQTSVTITLEAPPDSIEVKIRTAGGKPAAGASMWVYALSGPFDAIAKVKASAAGVVHLLGIDPAHEYRVVVWPGDWAAEYAGIWTAAQKEIPLPAIETIRGEVRAPDGHVIERVQLWRRSAIGHWILTAEHGRGRFEIRVPPGRHLLFAGSRPSPDSEEGVYVAAGATHAVVPFDPGPSLRFSFLDYPDPPAGFEVLAQDVPDAKAHGGWMNAEGVAEIVRLDAKRTYALWASPDRAYGEKEHGLCALLTGLVPDGSVREVRLVKSEPAYGRVELPKGTNVRAVLLWAVVHGIRINGRVSSDGTFRVPGLPRGTWPLFVTLEHAGKTLRAEAQTRADGPMELRLE